jgi:hypothetical protein
MQIGVIPDTRRVDSDKELHRLASGAFRHAEMIRHTHKPACRWENGVLLFNPGVLAKSPLLKRNRCIGIFPRATPF